MSQPKPSLDPFQLKEWQLKIKTANRNNIFCHCHHCGYEWIDSSFEASCPNCDSTKVERISCWQFPDD
ncbi:MAG: hypothetical protein QNJ54_10055 [Prochloraceae cyanobacterium]|nr:hypothetical protein [Prochloraceae cyanobacterium]